MKDTWYVCKCGADREQADELTICTVCKRIGCWVEEDGCGLRNVMLGDFDAWYDSKCEEARDE